jgi:hypothetical protein
MHPSSGGFGALPLREHIQARWANWAVRFARAMVTPERDRPPWVVVMDCILRGTHHPYNPLCVFTSRPEVPWFGEMTLPPDIKQVVMALACLPPVEDVGETPLVTGAWCWNVPLWGNPLLLKEGARGVGTRERPGLE